jgi:outer membrane protein OmpA-like peptidoglycan-associated protein
MYGQEPLSRHEISIWGAGGLSTLHSDLGFGKNIAGMGGQVGLGYNYAFNQHWSLGSGVEYSILNGGTKIPLFSDTYQAPSETSEYIYRITTEGDNVKQTYSAAYFNIPVLVKYQASPNKKGHRFYVAGGLKAGIPVSGNYRTGGFITTKGWELDADGNPFSNDPYINMPHHGFGTYELSDAKQDFTFGVNLAASLEAGIKWRLSRNEKTFLYTGLFVDYGLLDARKGSDGNHHLYQYNPLEPSQYIENSIFQSKYNNGTQAYVDKVNTLAAGVKVALAFSIDRKNESHIQKKQAIVQDIQTVDRQLMQSDNVWARQQRLQLQQETLKEKMDALEAECKAYLVAAAKRRQQYEQSISSPDIRELDNYDLARVTLTEEQKWALEQYVTIMKDNLHRSLDITGHTCDLGSEELNMRIGQERADLAKDFLVINGIAPSRIHTFSKGEYDPSFPNDNEVSRRKNRRIELKIIE